MPKKKKPTRTASKVGDESDEQCRRKRNMQAAMNEIETSTMHAPLSDTGQAECLQLRQAMADIDSDNETTAQTTTTLDETIPPEFIDSMQPGFVLSAMDLAKGTRSLEKMDAYNWMPINKNDPTFKCVNNRFLVKETRIAWEDVSDMIKHQANNFVLESLKKENAFPMHLCEDFLRKHKMSVRTKKLLNQAMLARYSTLQQAEEDLNMSSCPLHGGVPSSDLVLKVVLSIGDALTHREAFYALCKGSLNGNTLALLSCVSYMLNCEHIFERMLIRADQKARAHSKDIHSKDARSKDAKHSTDTKHAKHYESDDADFVTDLSTGRSELFRLCTVVYWLFQRYASTVSCIDRLYLYEMHTLAQAYKAHAQILAKSAASVIDKNQELLEDNEALAKDNKTFAEAALVLKTEMQKMLEEAEMQDKAKQVANQMVAAQFSEHHVKIDEQQQCLLQQAKEIEELHKQVDVITVDSEALIEELRKQVQDLNAEYNDFKAKAITAEPSPQSTKSSKLLTTGECAICLEGMESEIWALVPCGHTNVCNFCFDKHIKPALVKPSIVSFNCPSCQTEITSTIRVFGVERQQHENLDD